jgi:hypothetical protein
MQEDQEEISTVTQGFVPVLKLRALYISWFMINWTDRMWEFSVPFFLLTMDSIDSMRFALIYGMSQNISALSTPLLSMMYQASMNSLVFIVHGKIFPCFVVFSR